MLQNSQDLKDPVHFPADPGKFVFDSEVSAVFDNMAVRSIPNFLEAHAAHARMLRPWMKPGVSIMDIGASRGAFFRELKTQYFDVWCDSRTKVSAIDNSESMCLHLKAEFPEINVKNLSLESDAFLRTPQPKYDIVCANYVLQFVKPMMQLPVLYHIFGMVRPGGVLIWGHKSKHYGLSGELAHDEYIKFRMSHGYSREEIDAKTTALKNSMHPMDHAALLRMTSSHFAEVAETFRFMMFSTFFAVK